MNDALLPDANTAGVPASQYVGQYYATKRGIPTSNIVHVNVPLGCCSNDPGASDSWMISWSAFDSLVRQPIKAFLETNNLKNKIKYIVPVYGVPSHILSLSTPLPPNFINFDWPQNSYSIDSFLATMYSGNDFAWLANPYAVTDPTYFKSPIRTWVNPDGWPMYLVVRLDGPSSAIAMGLVDKAMQAESGLTKTSGTGYFDWQHSNNFGDASMKNAYNIALSKGLTAQLNDQSVTGHMIQSAPNTLWAWGWYSGSSYCACYSFVNGAVGAQLTSYTANTIRNFNLPGTWVPVWLRDGITATWGATGEPYSIGYASGDNLLNHFWNGYNFAEAAYQSSPVVNWMMIFVGDPLYSPNVFNTFLRARTTPRVQISAPNVSGHYYAGNITVSIPLPASPAVQSVRYTYNSGVVTSPLTTAPYAVTFSTDPSVDGPGIFSAIVTYTNGTTAIADPLPIVIAN